MKKKCQFFVVHYAFQNSQGRLPEDTSLDMFVKVDSHGGKATIGTERFFDGVANGIEFSIAGQALVHDADDSGFAYTCGTSGVDVNELHD